MANLEIFDVSKKAAKKIYSLGEVDKGKIHVIQRPISKTLSLVSSCGDVAYNFRRNILGAIPSGRRVLCNLWNLEYAEKKQTYDVKLLRKVKYSENQGQGLLSRIC